MMKAIILAAGRGTRLGHYTKEIPKGLVDINGKSIIERQIELFKKNGITEIIVVRGYKKEKFCWNDIRFIDNEDFANNNQLASLVLAQNEIFDAADDTILDFSESNPFGDAGGT